MKKSYRIIIENVITGEQIQTYCDTYKYQKSMRKWLDKNIPSDFKLVFCYSVETINVSWDIFKTIFESKKTTNATQI